MNVTRGVAVFDLAAQAALIVGVLAGAYLGRKREFRPHCLVMRVLMGGQILLIGVIMAPQLGRYLRDWNGFSAFAVEYLVHHTLGLVTLGLWIYINLAMAGVARAPRRYTWFMRGALASWVTSLALGVLLFWYSWR